MSLRAAWRDVNELHLHASILRGFHINAHKAPEGLVATMLSVNGPDAQIDAIDYPPGEERAFAFADKPLRVYDGEVIFVIRFRAAGAGPLSVALTYQACNEETCLAAVTRQITVTTPS